MELIAMRARGRFSAKSHKRVTDGQRYGIG